MTCREFERLCHTRLPGVWPSEARAHLAACPACAAAMAKDTAVDIALRQLGAAPPPVDVDAARAAIRQAIAEQPARAGVAGWGRPIAFALAGLGAAALLVAFLAWPAVEQRWHSFVVVRNTPSAPLPAPGGNGAGGPHPWKLRPVPRTEKRSPRAPAPLPARRERVEEPRLVSASPDAVPAVRNVLGGPDRAPAAPIRAPHSAAGGVSCADLLFLNEGPFAAARPYAPRPADAPLLPDLPPVQTRRPGSAVVDDLLNLNPVMIASADDQGLGAAARAIAAEEPSTDPRLQQKVFVHATSERLGDLLRGLSQATGVQLVARLEIADQRVCLWAEDRPLMEIMRDLRHLRGYYWSRSRQGGQYVYSLWQDAESRAVEEGEIQRQALEAQRQFAENIQKHVKALKASDAELKRLAQDDPYLAVQMLNPVVRNGYQLFAALAPDQQAQLLQGQTPSRGLSAGEMLETFPLASKPGDKWFDSPEYRASSDPLGDVVTLKMGEMTPEQRAAVVAIVRGAAQEAERESLEEQRQNPDPASNSGGYLGWHAQALAAADLGTATVSLFRWGDPDFEGLSVRVDVQSGGRGWGIYSNIGLPPGSEKFYNDALRQGKLRNIPGFGEVIDKYLDRKGKREQVPADEAALLPGESADPLLDAPISLTWKLAVREGHPEPCYSLDQGEVLAALSRGLRRPLASDAMPIWMELPRTGPAEFRWEKRPLRALLHHLFPGWPCRTEAGTIFINRPGAPHRSLNQVPPAVEAFLKARQGPFTLDDMALLARSLSPWQIVKLGQYLPNAAMDQVLAAQDLLRLYGELAPAQRAALAQGLSYAAMTPAQQALFLAFAERQRPFVEPWRFQTGGLRLTQEPAPTRPQWDNAFRLAGRVEFAVHFLEDDTARYPLELVGKPEHDPWRQSVASLVGKPFPGFLGVSWHYGGARASDPIRPPSLNDARLQGKPSVIIISRPFAEPYIGTHAEPASAAWARDLAARLRGSGITVVHETLGPRGATPAPPAAAPTPNLVDLWDEGDSNGQPFDSMGGGEHIDQSPTLFVVGSDEIVRAVFEGQDAWDMARVERAARELLTARPSPQQGSRRVAGG